MEVTYIEFMFPGSFFPETSTRQVPRRELPEAIPGNVAGYRFYSRQEVVVDGELLVGAPKDHSGWTYFGTEYSAEQVQAMDSDRFRVLQSNIRINGYTRLVLTVAGNWYPLQEGDVVVAEPSEEA